MQGDWTKCKDMSPDKKRGSELHRRGQECNPISGEIKICVDFYFFTTDSWWAT
jgi:hypothetical protein